MPDGTADADAIDIAVDIGLELQRRSVYSTPMVNVVTSFIPPAGWLEALAESEADLAAGRIVAGDDVMRDLRDSLARLDAKASHKDERRV